MLGDEEPEDSDGDSFTMRYDHQLPLGLETYLIDDDRESQVIRGEDGSDDCDGYQSILQVARSLGSSIGSG